MAEDAFTGGVAPGGLRDKNDVKILVCYLLNSLGRPLSFDAISGALQQDGLANYFTVGDAVSELLSSGHLEPAGESGKAYRVTALGAGTAALFERHLPLSVREKAVRAAIRLLDYEKRMRETKVDITPYGSGFQVRCAALDRADELFAVSLLVPDRAQAKEVQRRFVADPVVMYQVAVALLTGDLEGAQNALKNARKAPDSPLADG